MQVISAAAAAGKLAAVQYLHEHARCPWGADTTAAAAEASQLDTLKWLQGAGCPLDTTALQAAAKAGGAAAVDWLLAETPVISGLSPREAADSLEAAACVAAAAGHINLFESLFAGLVPALETAPPRATRGRGRGGPALQVGAAEPPPLRGPDGSTLARILEALAEGADADTLQSFVRTWVDDVEPDPRRQLDERQLNQAIIAAAGSTTPGWQVAGCVGVSGVGGVGCCARLAAGWLFVMVDGLDDCVDAVGRRGESEACSANIALGPAVGVNPSDRPRWTSCYSASCNSSSRPHSSRPHSRNRRRRCSNNRQLHGPCCFSTGPYWLRTWPRVCLGSAGEHRFNCCPCDQRWLPPPTRMRHICCSMLTSC